MLSFRGMGNSRGLKRDAACFKTLEQRRLKAARLLEQGVHQSEVARRVGVHRQSVSGWARQLNEAGRAGLKRAGRAGRKPKLSAADLKQVEQGLKRGPEA
jgi:transposase